MTNKEVFEQYGSENWVVEDNRYIDGDFRELE